MLSCVPVYVSVLGAHIFMAVWPCISTTCVFNLIDSHISTFLYLSAPDRSEELSLMRTLKQGIHQLRIFTAKAETLVRNSLACKTLSNDGNNLLPPYMVPPCGHILSWGTMYLRWIIFKITPPVYFSKKL